MGFIKKTNKKIYDLRYGLIRTGPSPGLIYLATNFVFLASLLVANLFLPNAFASSSYNASAVLGQSSYTANLVNNVAAPNDYGISVGSGATAIDSSHHRLFVTDDGNNRVLVFSLNSNDTVNSHHAANVLGQSDFTANAAATSATGMNLPNALLYIDSSQQLFVTDGGNNRILVFDLSGGITNGMAAANVLGEPTFTTSVQSESQTAVNLSGVASFVPSGLAYDSAGSRLFVTDGGNNRVLVFDLSGGITNGMAAANVLGQTDFTGAGCSPSNACGLFWPAGLVYDSGNNFLFVSDSAHRRVLQFDLSGGITNGMAAAHVLGQADFNGTDIGTSQTTMADPSGLSYDSANKYLFVSIQNDRVLVFDLSGGISNGMTASHILGQANFTGMSPDFFTPTQSSIFSPGGMTYDSTSQQLFVSEAGTDRVTIFDLSGGVSDDMNASAVLGQLSNGNPAFDVANNNSQNPSASGLSYPFDTALDVVNHRLFVADDNNNRVLVYKLNSKNQIISQNASYVLGQPNFYTSAETTTQAGMGFPDGLAYDQVHNRLFVGDEDNHRVLVFNLASGISDGMAASNVIGQPDFNSNTCDITQTVICGTNGLAYDPVHNRLFVGDEDSSRTLVFNLAGGISNGMAASYVLGQASFTSSNLDVPSQTNMQPAALSYDSVNNRLFVADSNGNRILAFNLAGLKNNMKASNVVGQANFTADNSGTTKSTFTTLAGLTYDSTSQNLFGSDLNDNRVLAFNLQNGISNGMAASLVIGQTNFTSNVSTTSRSGLSNALGLSYDSTNGRLFVADNGNERILSYDFATLVSSLPTGKSIGTSYNVAVGSQTQGSPHYSVSVGKLPPGLSLNSSSGVLSGSTTSSGTYNFSLKLVDSIGSAGSFTTQKAYSISVTAAASSTSSQITNPASSSGASASNQTNLINLNDYGNDANTGYNFGSSSGQTLRFELTTSLNNLEPHSLTVNSINPGDVNFTFDSALQPFDLAAGQSTEADLDGDNVADIGVLVDSIIAGKAEITIWQISHSSQTPVVPALTTQTPSNTSHAKWYEFGIGGFIVLIALLAFARRRRSRQPGYQLPAEPTVITPSHPAINPPAQAVETLSPALQPLPPLPQAPAPTFTQPPAPPPAAPTPQPQPLPSAPLGYQSRPSINLASNNSALNSHSSQQPTNRSNWID